MLKEIGKRALKRYRGLIGCSSILGVVIKVTKTGGIAPRVLKDLDINDIYRSNLSEYYRC